MTESPTVDLPVELQLRPQSVLLVFFADFVADAGVLVASNGVLDLLARLGVGEAAGRATLARMTRRGLLHREVRGRRAYFGLTDSGRRTMLGGQRRVQDDGVTPNARWDGAWTLVGFSMPDAWQRERHDLRARLTWAGFGMVQAGLWLAPRRVDVPELLDGLGLDDRVRVFEGVPAPPTDAARMVAEAYDLAGLAAGYTAFAERWSAVDPVSPTVDPLGHYVAVSTDWLQVVRDDPRLPLAFLPADWPAVPAEALYRRLSARLLRPAGRQFETRVDTIADHRVADANGCRDA